MVNDGQSTGSISCRIIIIIYTIITSLRNLARPADPGMDGYVTKPTRTKAEREFKPVHAALEPYLLTL